MMASFAEVAAREDAGGAVEYLPAVSRGRW